MIHGTILQPHYQKISLHITEMGTWMNSKSSADVLQKLIVILHYMSHNICHIYMSFHQSYTRQFSQLFSAVTCVYISCKMKVIVKGVGFFRNPSHTFLRGNSISRKISVCQTKCPQAITSHWLNDFLHHLLSITSSEWPDFSIFANN